MKSGSSRGFCSRRNGENKSSTVIRTIWPLLFVLFAKACWTAEAVSATSMSREDFGHSRRQLNIKSANVFAVVCRYLSLQLSVKIKDIVLLKKGWKVSVRCKVLVYKGSCLTRISRSTKRATFDSACLTSIRRPSSTTKFESAPATTLSNSCAVRVKR